MVIMSDFGNLYVIRSGDTGYYKIGITKRDVATRLKELQTGNHNKLEIVRCYQVEDMQSDEAAIHARLAEYRVSGEWYELDDVSIVDTLTSESFGYNAIDGYVLKQTGSEAMSDRFNFCLDILCRPDLGVFGKGVMFLWALFVPLSPVISKVPTGEIGALPWPLKFASDDADEDISELI